MNKNIIIVLVIIVAIIGGWFYSQNTEVIDNGGVEVPETNKISQEELEVIKDKATEFLNKDKNPVAEDVIVNELNTEENSVAEEISISEEDDLNLEQELNALEDLDF